MSKLSANSIFKSTLIALLFLLTLSSPKFLGLDHSPPGFYGDEVAGATQTLCLLEDAHDFQGNKLPLFAEGFPGAGQYTPVYLYGELVWVKIFGGSTASFRSFLGLVTCLTILFLYLWAKNKGGSQLAFYVALAASIMPWAFQFSRIAWDPPLAVLFLIMALWGTSLRSRYSWLSSIFLALAAYSYPPMRIAAPLFLFIIPGIRWKYKFFVILGAGVLCVPLLLKMQDPEFLARSRALAIWTYFNFNPYENLGLLATPALFAKQLISYFTPDFLFIHGDRNLRHSIQSFGMLSWLDLSALIALIFLFIRKILNKSEIIFSNNQRQVLQIALIGILAGTAPAALTHTSAIPNALRAIGAWPFFALLTGLILSRTAETLKGRIFPIFTLSIGLGFFALYLSSYFRTYPIISKNEFLSSDSKIESAYRKMSAEGESCKNLRVKSAPLLVGQEIFFSYGHPINGIAFLRSHWLEVESWGIWTNDKGSDLLLPLPIDASKKIIFKVRGLVTGAHPQAIVDVWVNGKFNKRVTITKFEDNYIDVAIPKNLHYPDKIWIEFRNINPTTPVAAGIPGNDLRITGLGLVSATFK
jgi:hypothetical protein